MLLIALASSVLLVSDWNRRIAIAAYKAKLPIFAFQSSQARGGAAVVLGRDYYDAGRAAALIAARVMQGENPASIPFQPFTKTRIIINRKAARASSLTLPLALVRRADEIIE